MAPEFEVIDERFGALLISTASLEKLYTGMIWAEGPVYFAEGDYLLFSDIPNNRMLQYVPGLGTRVFRSPSDFSNGNTRNRQGRLVTCEHGTRRVSRTEPDGSITVLADRHQGKRLNSPNDVVVKSDGSVWFTDPPYGIMSNYQGYQADSEIGSNNVYRLDCKTGELRVVIDDFEKPNGLAFSPDEKILYIADSAISNNPTGATHIRAFDVTEDGRLKNSRVFCQVTPGFPDGFRLDIDGNLWSSAKDGVQCFSPDGQMLGKIRVPEHVANVCFGGPRRDRLYITASSSLYAVTLAARGAQWK